MIDLHMHTSHSDGTDSVEELLKNAENKKLEIISITDHDQIEAYNEIEQKPELRKLFSGKIIIGAELKTYFDKVPIEILAYGFDYKKLKIHKVDNEKMQKEVLEKLKSIAQKERLKYDEKNTYIDETYASIDINETIKRVHEAGGIAFLAHAYEYPFKNTCETVEKILSTTDIDGLECIYPTFSEEQRKVIFDLSKKYNKYCSGGSDYHAKNKPNIEMGYGINKNICIKTDFIENWIEKVKMI